MASWLFSFSVFLMFIPVLLLPLPILPVWYHTLYSFIYCIYVADSYRYTVFKQSMVDCSTTIPLITRSYTPVLLTLGLVTWLVLAKEMWVDVIYTMPSGHFKFASVVWLGFPCFHCLPQNSNVSEGAAPSDCILERASAHPVIWPITEHYFCEPLWFLRGSGSTTKLARKQNFG